MDGLELLGDIDHSKCLLVKPTPAAIPATLNVTECGLAGLMPKSLKKLGLRRGRYCVAVSALLWASAGTASIELSTSVARVVRLATEGGGVETLLLDARSVQPGQELRYTIEFTNASNEFIDPGVIVITNPIPEMAEYLEGTATGPESEIEFSVDGGMSFASPESLTIVENGALVPATPPHYTTLRFTFGGILGPGEGSAVAFGVRLLEEAPLDAPLLESIE